MPQVAAPHSHGSEARRESPTPAHAQRSGTHGATPLFQKPLEHGIDVVVHSLTKYVGGHSDVLGGAVVGSAAFVRDLFYAGFQVQGSVMSALEAWLVLRGLRTLPVRMAEHQRNAIRVVDYLQTRPEVAAVHHFHADHRLHRERVTGFIGLLSLDLAEATPQAVARGARFEQVVKAMNKTLSKHNRDPYDMCCHIYSHKSLRSLMTTTQTATPYATQPYRPFYALAFRRRPTLLC